MPVARFRIASTPRYRDNATGEWKDGDTLFLTCQVWRQAAENVAETLQKGTRTIVTGRLRQRSYETSEGEKRTVYELQVDEVGVSLRNATAKVTKATRAGNGQGGGEGEASGSYSDEPPDGRLLVDGAVLAGMAVSQVLALRGPGWPGSRSVCRPDIW